MSKFEIKRAKGPVEEVILTLTEDDFQEIFNLWKTRYPTYYSAALQGGYPEDDLMVILIGAARELDYEL